MKITTRAELHDEIYKIRKRLFGGGGGRLGFPVKCAQCGEDCKFVGGDHEAIAQFIKSGQASSFDLTYIESLQKHSCWAVELDRLIEAWHPLKGE